MFVNQKIVERLLERQGHTVVIAANGKEALAALERERFDLVLMDVQMPEMDGLEAAATIRERERGTDLHLPIIALTASAMAGDKEQCLAARHGWLCLETDSGAGRSLIRWRVL